MISDELISGFETQLTAIKQALGVERTALAGCEERDQVRIKQHRVTLLEAFQKAVEDARAKIIVADAERLAGEKKFIRWLELLPMVRAAKDEVEALERGIPVARVLAQHGARQDGRRYCAAS